VVYISASQWLFRTKCQSNVVSCSMFLADDLHRPIKLRFEFLVHYKLTAAVIVVSRSPTCHYAQHVMLLCNSITPALQHCYIVSFCCVNLQKNTRD